MPIGFSHPLYLWLLLLAGPVAWAGVHYLRPLSTGRRRAAVTLRLLAMLLVVLALAGAQAVRHHDDLSVITVVDESESMVRFAPRPMLDASAARQPTSLREWSQQWLQLASRGRRPDDRLGLVTYDARPTVVAMPTPSGVGDVGIVSQPWEGSRGGAAIRLAMAMLPPDTARRLVLVSDGNDTSEVDLLAAARQAAGAGVPIDVMPVTYMLENEVMVEGLYSPAQAREGQTAAIRVVLRSTKPVAGQLFLMRNGEPVDLNGLSEGQGEPVNEDQWVISRAESEQSRQAADASGRYTLVKLIELPLSESGSNRFEAIFEPQQQMDAVVSNNRATAFTLVRGAGKVLIVSQEPAGESAYLAKAFIDHGMQTQIVTGSGLPADLASLSRYDAVVMQNVSAELMDDTQQTLLTQYVADTGGGLVMIGGPDSFGAGGWTNTTLSKILPVDCELPAQLILPTGALVLVIDRSGSMQSGVQGSTLTQQQVAAEAAVMAIATLYPRDLVGVVSFDTASTWEVPLAFNQDRRGVMDKVRSIQPGGGTNIYIGLEAAYQALAQVETDTAAIKHIILLTDGQSHSNNFPDLMDRLKSKNISLSTIGVGDGVDGNLLSTLAREGGGKYYAVTNPRQLPQVFIKEARTIRKNLIREVTFTPKLVLSGSPMVTGLNGVPSLDGFVRTAHRKDPRIFVAMVGPEDEPILAHWQVGLGQVAAFTSDASSRWGSQWVAWPGYGDFWSRMVRSISRPGSSPDLELTSSFVDDELVLKLDASQTSSLSGVTNDTTQSSFSQLAQVQAAVVGPDGKRQLVTLQQTGPGLYEVKVPAATSGSYLVSVLGENAQGEKQFVSSGANRPPGLELRRFASNQALLQEVAQITGGRVLQADAGQVTGLFDREGKIEASRSIRPLWQTLVWLLLPLFLMDVAVRRLSWDPSAIRDWLGIRQGGHTRAGDAQQTLSALKQKSRKKTSSSQPQQPQPELPRTTYQTMQPAEAEAATAEAATEEARRPALQNPGIDLTRDKPAAASDEPATGTSRLMDAKRRARQKYDES